MCSFSLAALLLQFKMSRHPELNSYIAGILSTLRQHIIEVFSHNLEVLQSTKIACLFIVQI